MKAALISRYGSPDDVKVGEAPKPRPGPGDVLVRVHAGTVNRSDSGELSPKPQFIGRLMFGLTRPRRTIFGLDFAGVVEATGADVLSFKPGDRVFGMCSILRNGAHAEYTCVAESGPIATMPENARFEDVVVCEGAYYAEAGLKKFHVGPGSEVLIYGASGAIGSAAVQLAKSFGAHVTAVVPTQHVEMARAIGADRVIDYTAGDFTKTDARFDYIMDAVGKAGYSRCRRLLKPNGVYAGTDVGPGGSDIPYLLWSAISGDNKVSVPLQARGSGHAFVAAMKERLQAGQFRAMIDRRYPLDQIAEAYRYVMTGQKAGIVVINVVPD